MIFLKTYDRKSNEIGWMALCWPLRTALTSSGKRKEKKFPSLLLLQSYLILIIKGRLPYLIDCSKAQFVPLEQNHHPVVMLVKVAIPRAISAMTLQENIAPETVVVLLHI